MNTTLTIADKMQAKLTEWYGDRQYKYEPVYVDEYTTLVLVEYDTEEGTVCDLVRIFPIGNDVALSVDKSDTTLNFNNVAELISIAISKSK